MATMTRKDVCTILDVSGNTLRSWLLTGDFPLWLGTNERGRHYWSSSQLLDWSMDCDCVDAVLQARLRAASACAPKICVQVGKCKRYYNTREEALAALAAYNVKQHAL